MCFVSFLSFGLTVWDSPVQAEATYQLTFDSGWTSATHPGAYPFNAHFSPLIGGTHNGSVSYWEVGGIASNGIEVMAESGSPTILRNEIQANINSGDSTLAVVQGPAIDGPGTGSVNFTVTGDHPLLTMVTMIAPSPDWFVGVSGFDLRENGQWVESLSIDLQNYDSGTDAGTGFTSPNSNVTPHQPISMVGAPLAGLPALGSFTFTLLDATAALCDFDLDGSCGIADLEELLSLGPVASGIAVDYATNHKYDLNGDEVIDLQDRDAWLAGAAAENDLLVPYSPADADLNGVTDGADFLAWNANKFTSSLQASAGDFNGDGVINGGDFLVWNQFKFGGSDVAAVPEPAHSMVMMLAALCLVWGPFRKVNR
jgi:hypothetical protein